MTKAFEGLFILSEIVVIILYAACTKYGAGMLPSEISKEDKDLLILQTDID